MTSPQLRGALLDVDGTLIDSNDAHAMSWVDALRAFGHEVPFDRVRELIGMGGDKLLPEVTGIDKDSPPGQEISARRSLIFKRDYLPSIRPFDGARELLERMRRDRLMLVVASSAQRDELGALLAIVGAEDLIAETTSSSDADRSKPDPDIIQAALARSGLKPREALMLGDTPYDIEASGKAGVASVALRCGGWGDGELAGALGIYDSPRDLLRHYDASPFARR